MRCRPATPSRSSAIPSSTSSWHGRRRGQAWPDPSSRSPSARSSSPGAGRLARRRSSRSARSPRSPSRCSRSRTLSSSTGTGRRSLPPWRWSHGRRRRPRGRGRDPRHGVPAVRPRRTRAGLRARGLAPRARAGRDGRGARDRRARLGDAGAGPGHGGAGLAGRPPLAREADRRRRSDLAPPSPGGRRGRARRARTVRGAGARRRSGRPRALDGDRAAPRARLRHEDLRPRVPARALSQGAPPSMTKRTFPKGAKPAAS